MRTVHLGAAKAAAAEELPPGHPGREAILALPDRMGAPAFDAVFPLLVRLLKTPSSGGRPGVGNAGAGGPTDGSGRPRK